jgi:hypothetical protein
MEIVCLGRDAYRRRHEQRFHGELQDRFGPFHLIPEGGTNALGIQGIAELVQELPDAIDVICCPFGTGGTSNRAAEGPTGHSARFGAPGLLDACARRLRGGYPPKTAVDTGQVGGVRVVENTAIVATQVPVEWRSSQQISAKFGFDLDPIYNANGLVCGSHPAGLVPARHTGC